MLGQMLNDLAKPHGVGRKKSSILVETFGRVRQSQKAIVGRPLKWTQSGCLLLFSVQRRVASARSFNIYPSMLQIRLIIEFTQGPML